jgi:diacylglycerol kinase family enzyme
MRHALHDAPVATILIVNPYASGVTDELVERVEAALVAPVATVRTDRQHHATELARDLEPDADAIVVFSGDGTYNEVLNGVTGGTPLGFVPGGGTSVLPRALGLPRDPVAAARAIARGRARRIGLGRVNGRRFGFSCGVGLDAELVRRVDRRGRGHDGRRPGDLAFVAAGLQTVRAHGGRFEPMLDLEGIGRAAFALVANCSPYTYLGPLGLRLAPRASFDAGLDVVAPVRVGRLGSLAFAARAAGGRLDRSRSVLYAHDLDRLVIRCDAPSPVQVDGEDLGDGTELELVAERDAVTVLV